LLYLSYTPLESLDDDAKRDFAYNLGVAALVGEETYNFGDLVSRYFSLMCPNRLVLISCCQLAHPIVDSLNGTKREWLAHLLRAFNQGDIAAYESLIARYGSELEQEVTHVPSLLLLVF